MKVKAYCIVLKGRKIIAKFNHNDLTLPGGDVEQSKAQEQLSKIVLDQCGLVITKPVLIADLDTLDTQLYIAYVNMKKNNYTDKKGTWDEDSLQDKWTDEVTQFIQTFNQQTLMHYLLLIAMRLIKMILDKSYPKKPANKTITNHFRVIFQDLLD